MNGILTICAVLAVTSMMPIIPRNAPLDRVIPNLEARILERPDDARAYYSLGRAHALAFATKRDSIRVYQFGDRFEPLPPDAHDFRGGKKSEPGDPIAPEALKVHLRESVDNLVKAIRLRREARFYLALGSILETASADRVALNPGLVTNWKVFGGARDTYVDNIPDADRTRVVRARVLGGVLDPAVSQSFAEPTVSALWDARSSSKGKRLEVILDILNEFWQDQTADAYFIAFSLSLASEAKFDNRPWGSTGLRISVESGESFLRVTDNERGRSRDATRRAIARSAVAELSKQQQSGGITPIIFPLGNEECLADLIDEEASVAFDMNGTGLPQRWTWVRPSAGLLVWDPAETGEVTSGRQLFGSVTWWIMFDDGYQALDALDDDRDRFLSGDELKGISVWIDFDSDATADDGEVIPVQMFGVAKIATFASSFQDGIFSNYAGILFDDGRQKPTFDWVAKPSPDQEAAAFDAQPSPVETMTRLDGGQIP
jgi:hypothetical protein